MRNYYNWNDGKGLLFKNMWITKHFKSFFLRGLAVLLPSILTIGIFVWGFRFLQDNISIHINRGLVKLIMLAQKLTSEETPWPEDVLNQFWVDGAGSLTGFVVALVFVCLVGVVLASVVGKTLWRLIERFIMGTPFLGRVYPYMKQVTDFVLKQAKQDKLKFSRVVAAEYPRKGVWSLGLVTGSGLAKVTNTVKRDLLTVFIPTSPTPFTGFIIMIPRKQTIEVDLTIEEVFRFTISGGVITPGSDVAAALEEVKPIISENPEFEDEDK